MITHSPAGSSGRGKRSDQPRRGPPRVWFWSAVIWYNSAHSLDDPILNLSTAGEGDKNNGLAYASG